MKKSININGISTTAAYQEGDCMNLINLRKKNGVLKAVTARKIVRTTAERYVYTFQHNLPQTGSNLIGIRNNTIYLVNSDNSELELTSTTGFKSITQIGNILNVLDSSGIKMLFWVDNVYKIIETNSADAQTSLELLPVKIDIKVDNKGIVDFEEKFRSNFNVISSDNVAYSDFETYSSEENLTLRKEMFKGITTKLISLLRENGHHVGFIIACSAIELYDGNYILHSAPVLLGQANDLHTRYSELDINTHICDYADKKALFLPSGEVVTSDTENNIVEYKESDVFGGGLAISSGSYISQAWFPSVIGSSNYEGIDLNDRNIPVKSCVYISSMKFKVNADIPEKYKSIVKSVSIFVSKEVLPFDLEKVESIKNTYLYFTDSKTHCVENYYFKPKSTADIIKELSDNQQFYKVHEIPFDDIKKTSENDGWVEIDLKGKLGDNLVNQEELPVDNFSHHSLLPNKQMVYNSKIHVMDYKQEFFRGWSLNYLTNKNGRGQFQSTSSGDIKRFYVEVSIKTGLGTSKVVRYFDYNGDSENMIPSEISGFNPMITYPDSRAFKIKIYSEIYQGINPPKYMLLEYNLKGSETANFAYYISPDLKPIDSYDTGAFPFNVPAEENRSQIFRNQMKVSSVNNPFYFPNETTYIIGTQTVLNAGTNALRMSEGQYGQYDLYVITTEGTYSFDTGTEISYNRKAPASLVKPVSEIICSTPYGIVFIGVRGIYMLSGQKPELLSQQIEEEPKETTVNLQLCSFSSFLKSVKDILYDPYQNEIIVVSSTYNYNWVLNIDNKMWYLSTEKIDFEIKNSSPGLLVMSGNDIKDYSQSQTTKATVEITTRPIYFGVDEFKKLNRSILRATLLKLKKNIPQTSVISIFGSNDGINFILLRGMILHPGTQEKNFKDLDLGLMSRSTYRNYTILFEGEISEESEIKYIDFDVADNYTNDKLR